jgi:hypothetical protein
MASIFDNTSLVLSAGSDQVRDTRACTHQDLCVIEGTVALLKLERRKVQSPPRLNPQPSLQNGSCDLCHCYAVGAGRTHLAAMLKEITSS